MLSFLPKLSPHKSWIPDGSFRGFVRKVLETTLLKEVDSIFGDKLHSDAQGG